MPTHSTIADLLYRSLARELSPSERVLIDEWAQGHPKRAAWLGSLEEQLRDAVANRSAPQLSSLREELFDRIQREAGIIAVLPRHPVTIVFDTAEQSQADLPAGRPTHRVHFLKRAWVRYAAAVIIISGVGAYLWNNYRTNTKEHTGVVIPSSPDILPGTDKAVLSVDDQQIDLSPGKTGITVGDDITYTDGEKLSEAGQMLTLATPRGGQYQAVLPDGTKVWLNAASSIRFPSKFSNNERRVEVSGEVYMEVAQHPKQPFHVSAGNTVIQVLGTSFNINAYPGEEGQRTTLINGSVKILSNQQAVILQPGEAADVSKDLKIVKNKHIDVEQVIAWKNGYFSFKGMSIDELLRQLERWYDITVSYENGIPDVALSGEMTRDIPLNTLLPLLQEMGLQYRLEERRLIVLPGREK